MWSRLRARFSQQLASDRGICSLRISRSAISQGLRLSR
jgi:hypothetical protein